MPLVFSRKIGALVFCGGFFGGMVYKKVKEEPVTRALRSPSLILLRLALSNKPSYQSSEELSASSKDKSEFRL